MVESARVRKLRWLCRRGMKELDILLERFISDREQDLADGEWPGFENLLGTEDDVLWDWVQDPSRARGIAATELLDEIRKYRAGTD